MIKLGFKSLLHIWNIMDFGVKTNFIGVANKSFGCMFKVADYFHLFPFSKIKDGEYVLKTGTKLRMHYIAHVIGVAFTLQKIFTTLETFITKTAALTRVFSMFFTILPLGCYIAIVGVLSRPQETIDLLNSWAFLDLIGKKEAEMHKRQIVSHSKVALKLIEINSAFLLCLGIAIPLASVVDLSPSPPVFCHVLALRLGIVPNYVGQSFFWRLLFAPIELTTFFPLACVTAISVDILIVGLDNHKKLADYIRSLPVRNKRTRDIVERKYVAMEVYNKIFSGWFRFIMPQGIFVLSAVAIFDFYICLRVTELPISYDTVCIGRSSDESLSKLRSIEWNYMRFMMKPMKVTVVKRAKAMQSITFPIGDFCKFSMTVTYHVYVEILNQLLFSLSF